MDRKIITINKKLAAGALAVITLSVVAPYIAYAALTANSTLTQSITAGTISTDFRNASNVLVSGPTFTMNAINVSNSLQTATGTYGDTTRRISVDNPGGANNGWTLTLNAAVPATDVWTSGGNTYDFNAATAAAGQLTVNPSPGTLTAVVGTTTGITKGSSATFNSTSPVTIMSAASGADDISTTSLYGVTLSQTVPASTPAGSYSITMVQTVAAI